MCIVEASEVINVNFMFSMMVRNVTYCDLYSRSLLLSPVSQITLNFCVFFTIFCLLPFPEYLTDL